MTTTATLVRYDVRPGRAEENAGLVRAVYDELARTRPAGLRYATFQADGGEGFVHVADDERDVLPRLAAFRAFQAGVPERVQAPPAFTAMRLVGSYRAFAEPDGVALDYLGEWCAGELERAGELVADDLVFEGPTSSARSKEDFLALSEPLRPLLRGHEVLHAWGDGDETCVVYDLRLGDGMVRVVDWLTVRDGLIVADRVLFDTAAFSRAAGSSR